MSGVGGSSSVGGGYPRYLRDLYRTLQLKDKDGDRIIEDRRVWDRDAEDMVRHDGDENYRIEMDINNDGIIDQAEAKYTIQTTKVWTDGQYYYSSADRARFALNQADRNMLSRDLVVMLQKTRLRSPAKITPYTDIKYAFRIAREAGAGADEMTAEALRLAASVTNCDSKRECIINLAEAIVQDRSMSAKRKEQYFYGVVALAEDIVNGSGKHEYWSQANAMLVVLSSMKTVGVSTELLADAILSGLRSAYRIDNSDSKSSMTDNYKQLMRSFNISNAAIEATCKRIDDELSY